MSTTKPNVYEVITSRILEQLEQGTVPWRKPWRGGEQGLPRNLKSGRAYRGINVFLLAAAAYESPYWLTFKQAREAGGTVRKGETGYPVVFWNWIDKDERLAVLSQDLQPATSHVLSLVAAAG